jgi:hypothetical protein
VGYYIGLLVVESEFQDDLLIQLKLYLRLFQYIKA